MSLASQYFSWLVEDNSNLDFIEFGMVWKVAVPPKVQIFAWTVALGIINTREKIGGEILRYVFLLPGVYVQKE